MFDLRQLERPVIAAPMAGGISTPDLVAAAAAAGGMGFLAAGYKTVDQLREEIMRTRELGAEVFGANLFVPDAGAVSLDDARAYRSRLLPLAEGLGVDLPEPREDDDAYAGKIAALLSDPVPVVSFTFGCPSDEVIRGFRAVGTATVATVTSPEEAAQASAVGVDALVVQGPEAGGHRATFDAQVSPPDQALPDLIRSVRSVADLPIVATGGLTTPDAVRAALELAEAVQIGTALLDSDEAATTAPYRRALHDPRFTDTVTTRAFSGRWARGLRNAFIDEFGADAPAAYPAVNQLTGPIRRAAAAAGDPERLSLWAGTGWRSITTGPAASIIEALCA